MVLDRIQIFGTIRIVNLQPSAIRSHRPKGPKRIMTDEEILDAKWDVDFDVAKSMRYHAYRRSFWEMCDYLNKVLTWLAGSAVLVALIGSHAILAEVFAFCVAFLSASDIIFGFGTKARTHNGLYRSFCMLGQNIVEILHPTETQIAEWRRRRLELEMDEPGVLDWLERRCSAEEARARGVEPRPSWVLPRWKIALSQLAAWPSSTAR